MILAAAAVLNGLVAGLFQAFGYAVMPGLARTDGVTFVRAMRAMNVAILGPWFFLLLLGAPLLTAAAGVLALTAGAGGTLPWIVGALVCYLLTLGITGRVNVPLNDGLHGAPVATVEEQRTARAGFEARWVRWNHVRSVTSTAACAALVVALLIE